MPAVWGVRLSAAHQVRPALPAPFLRDANLIDWTELRDTLLAHPDHPAISLLYLCGCTGMHACHTAPAHHSHPPHTPNRPGNSAQTCFAEISSCCILAIQGASAEFSYHLCHGPVSKSIVCNICGLQLRSKLSAYPIPVMEAHACRSNCAQKDVCLHLTYLYARG